LQGKQPLIPEVALDNCIGTYQEAVSNQKSAGNKLAGEAFLAKNGQRPGVVTLPSGLQYEVIKNSTDTLKPKLNNKVKVHYHGTLLNGEVFDSSVDRGEPIVYPLGQLIVGWQEALQLMTVGSKWKLYVPSELGYGNRGSGKIAPGSTLVFEVELLGFE
jgi:FKBP-type peptidyl-prolyl cis-trans isomerase FklB